MKQLLLLFIGISSIFVQAGEKNFGKFNSQNSYGDYCYLECHVGPSYIFYNPVSENMYWGINRDLRLRFEIFEGKMSLGPHIGFRTFNEHIIDVIRVNNRISDLNYGLHLGYSLFQSEDRYFNVTNFFEFNYSHVENNIFNNSKTQKINIAKGNAFSMVAGYRVIYKWAFLETRYHFLNGNVNLSKEYMEILAMEGLEYTEIQKLPFNSLSVVIGVSVTFNELKKIPVEQIISFLIGIL